MRLRRQKQVSVQPVTEVPCARCGVAVLRGGGRVLLLRLRAALRRGGRALSALPPPRRRCLLPAESRPRRGRWLANAYSRPHCQAHCRLQRALALCRCTPYFFGYRSDYRICKMEDIPCLINVSRPEQWRSCLGCPPACSYYSYSVAADYEPNTHRNPRDAYVDLHYDDAVAVMYRQDLTFGTYEFVVSVGGILSLCLGLSVLSLFELAYLGGRLVAAVGARYWARMRTAPLLAPRVTERAIGDGTAGNREGRPQRPPAAPPTWLR